MNMKEKNNWERHVWGNEGLKAQGYDVNWSSFLQSYNITNEKKMLTSPSLSAI